MRNVPINAQPEVGSGTHAQVGCDSGKQLIASAPTLGDCGNAVILRVLPSYDRPDKPFAGTAF